MADNSIDNKSVAESVKAEVVTIDGVKRLKDPAGVLLQHPYSYYVNVVRHISNALLGLFPELKHYVNRLFPVFTFAFDTFATGYGYIFMNPYFLDELIKKSKELKDSTGTLLPTFVYMHEIYHNLFSHIADGKRNEAEYPDHMRQNIAMDYTINGVIETLYGLEGATEAIGGYINHDYDNKDWTWVYKDIEKKDLDVSKQSYKKIVDEYNKVKEGNKQQSGSSIPPQNQEVDNMQDFIDGYKSRYSEIKNIIEGAINAGKTVEEIIDVLKDEAKKKGIKCFEAYLPYPSSNDSYNKGVEAAYADAINRLKTVLKKTGTSKEEEYKGRSDTKMNQNLRNAVDDLYNQLSSGTPSNSKEDNDNNSDKSNNQNDSSNQSNSENDFTGKTTGDYGKNPDEMSSSEKEHVMSRILDDRHLDKEEDTKTASQTAEDLKKHLEKLPVESPEAADLKKQLKGELDKKFPIAKVNTGVDWKEVLEDYITRCREEQVSKPNINAVAKTIDYYKSNRVIDSRYKTQEAEGINHIVIALDNSGSVCSNDSVPDFLGALVEIFDNALSDNVVVDFIQFDTTIRKCTRIVHKQGDSITEIKKVSDATGGGTDYLDVMKLSELLVLDWEEDNPKLGNISIPEEFESHEAEGGDDIFEISPAVCSIIFTDTDFYWGRKYEDMNPEMLEKMKFVILTTRSELQSSRDVGKYDTIYIDRGNWEYGNGKLSESFLINAIKNDIEMSEPSDDNEQVGFIDLVDSEFKHRFAEDNIKAEIRDNKIWVVGDMSVRGSSLLMDKYFYDGNMKIEDFSEGELGWLPMGMSSNSSILFYNCNISDSYIEELKQRYSIEDIISVNDDNLNEWVEQYPSLSIAFAQKLNVNSTLNIKNAYYYLNKDGKKQRVDIKLSKRENLFQYLTLNKYFSRAYINLGEMQMFDYIMDDELYYILKYFGNIFSINLCEVNLQIEDRAITGNFIEGLPRNMARLRKLYFIKCLDSNELMKLYKEKHSIRQNIGTTKNFDVLIIK